MGTSACDRCGQRYSPTSATLQASCNQSGSLFVKKLFVILLAALAMPAWAQSDALKRAAKEPGATVTSSGLVYRSLKDGSGPSPGASDIVRVHYRGTFPDGKEFDSSYSRGQPTEFPLNRVIKCWTE